MLMFQSFHYYISNSNDLQNFPHTNFDIEAALATKFDPEVKITQQCYWHGSRVTNILQIPSPHSLAQARY